MYSQYDIALLTMIIILFLIQGQQFMQQKELDKKLQRVFEILSIMTLDISRLKIKPLKKKK